MRTNRYEGDCSRCGKLVPANAGTLEGPPWRTYCAKCLPRVEAGVRFETAGEQVVASLTGYLGNTFGVYRQAMGGWKFDKASKIYSAPASMVGAALKVLKRKDVPAFVSAEVEALVNGAVKDRQAELDKADERASAVDAILAKRGHSLYNYQRTGVRWLAPRHAAILGDDMGLGKTLQALVAAPEGAPILVVCPAVAKGVWVREAAQWRSDLSSVALSGRKAFRWPDKGEMAIMNWDILPPSKTDAKQSAEKTTAAIDKTMTDLTIAERNETRARLVDLADLEMDHVARSWHARANTTLARKTVVKKAAAMANALEMIDLSASFYAATPKGVVVVADEAHAAKNPKAARTRSFRAMKKAVRLAGGCVWLLTGTPLLNRPPELWALLTAAGLEKETFGSWPTFAKLMGGEQVSFRAKGKTVTVWEWNGRPAPQVAEMLQKVMLRRLKVDVLEDLPPIRYETINVNGLSASLRKKCDKALEKIGPQLQRAEEKAEDTADLESIPFEEISEIATALALAKVPSMLSLVEEHEESEEPLVVFSAHRAPVDALSDRPGWAVITGDTSPGKRTEIEDAFQAGKLKGVAGTIQAAGVAITLTRASRALFVDRLFTPALNAQARDRIYRIGQSRGVLITYLVADHALDRRVSELLSSKEALISATVDAARVDGDRDVAGEELALLSDVETSDVAAEVAEYERRLSELSAELDASAREIAEKTELDRLNEKIARRCGLWDLGSNKAEDVRRAAETEEERKAVAAVKLLSDMDPDRAFEINEAGWNKADGYVGHALATLVDSGLTDAGWKLATRIIRKYHRQIEMEM